MVGATEDLHRGHITDLRTALQAGGDQLPGALVDQCEQMLGAIEERLALGVDHTIVALAGGTGSGKSSTFNAISGLEFADVGVLRPTTARINACSWSSDASKLLDWLSVDTDRRIIRDTILDGAQEREFDGLILLDLPDHDSVAEHHKDIVDAVLPLVDLLIWVVDPQKYADQALHAGYLRKLVGAQASMVVAVNQIDKVSPTAQELLIIDIEKMLISDGLDKVVVRAVSAKTGEGIDQLRTELKGAVARRSMASTRMRDELARLGELILAEVPRSVITDPEPMLGKEVDKILVASGVVGLSDQVGALQRTKQWTEPRPKLRAPGRSQITALRAQWVQTVTDGMTEPWAQEVSQAIPEPSAIEQEMVDRLAEVRVPWEEDQAVTKATKTAFGAALVGGLFAVLLILDLAGVLPTGLALIWGLGVAICGAIAFLSWNRSVKFADQWGKASSGKIRSSAEGAALTGLENTYVDPIKPILKRHEQVRRLAHRVSTAD